MVVAKNSSIQDVKDLKGSSIVVIGGRQSGSFINVVDILKAYQIKKGEVSLLSSSLPNALRDLTKKTPTIQAIFFTSGQKVDLLRQFGGKDAKHARIRLLSVTRIASEGNFFQRDELKKNSILF